MGFFKGPEDMAQSAHLDQVKQTCQQFDVSPDTVDTVINELMRRFV